MTVTVMDFKLTVGEGQKGWNLFCRVWKIFVIKMLNTFSFYDLCIQKPFFSQENVEDNLKLLYDCEYKNYNKYEAHNTL